MLCQCCIISQRENDKETDYELKQAFRVLDKVLLWSFSTISVHSLEQDGSGHITSSELKFVLDK